MTLSAGTRVGPYEILAPLGVGGMGEVYRALDPRLGREVALKVLPEELSADTDRLARFEREARSASALNHPHIVTVYDVGRADSLSYIAMELVDGRTLRDIVASGPVPGKRSIAIAAQAADALAKAHSAGIVHRDLKPENVMVSRDGFVKILDFGLAKLVAPSSSGSGSLAPTAIDATRPGAVLGTVGYMSPEQARGTDVDFRSDQFSFGSILYEMAAGRRAFHGDSAPETMAAIIREDPEPLSRIALSTPAPYRWIVDRCLAKDPDDRYASTRDLARELASLREHLSEIDRSETAVFPAPGSIRRQRRSALLPVGLAVLAFAAGVGAAVLWRARGDPPLPPALRTLTYSGQDQSPAVSPDGRTIAFTSKRDGTPRIWVKQLATGGEAAITAGPDDFARFSPDGAAILYQHREGNSFSIYRASVVGGEPRKVLGDASQGDWSPDGKSIAFLRWSNEKGATVSTVGVAAADGTGERQIARVANHQLVQPRWSPDGSVIAAAELGVAGAPRSYWLVDARSGAVRALPSLTTNGFLSSPAWSASGKEIIYSQAESVVGNVTSSSARIMRQDVRSGKGRVLLWIPSAALSLNILGKGQLVFDASPVRENLREVALGDRLAEEGRWLTQGNASDRQPCYSPDGEWVVFSSNRSGNLDLWEVSRKTGAVRRVTDDSADDWDPGFAADGKLMWSSNRTGAFEIWIAEADGSGARQVTKEGKDAENPTATPDGAWILYNQSFPEKAGIWKVHPDGSGNTRIISGTTVLPEVSRDGQFVSYRTNLRIDQFEVRVARVSDGAMTSFRVNLPVAQASVANSSGRSRWMPDGKAIAFVGQDDRGAYGIYVQDFDPGKDTAATRRQVAGFYPGLATESFGISPDGKEMTLAGWDQVFSLMLAERVPGIEAPPRMR
ncbi:MAG: protein kinase [Acidobacteriota bacterium]|nr:protein kinase [Acidobacteriota bacterium]MDQ5872282.1 protein kinase [Acidobacteriota bacterium]